jgi:hypothetical protein
MQVERLIRAASWPHRKTFRLAGQAMRWLAATLSPAESASLQRFLGA